MAPLTQTFFLMGVGLGTTITMASSHWFLAWIGLELNMLAILPLMMQYYYPRSTEATAKYFVIQASGAATLVFACMTNAFFTGTWDIQDTNHPVSVLIVTAALAFKMGLAPVHAWLPEVLQGLDLTVGLVLSTWQKLAPLALLLQIQSMSSITLILLGLTSTLVGGWGGMNQTQLRKFMAYSSIAHLGWMILVSQFSPALALLTLLVYLAMTSAAFLTFKLNHATDLNSLGLSWAKTPILTAITPLILLSLAGLPPLSGFLPKWMILQELTLQGLAITAVVAALTALLSLFFYLRIAYSYALTMMPNNITGTIPWQLPHTKHTLPLATSTSATALLLPLAPTIMALLFS